MNDKNVNQDTKTVWKTKYDVQVFTTAKSRETPTVEQGLHIAEKLCLADVAGYKDRTHLCHMPNSSHNYRNLQWSIL